MHTSSNKHQICNFEGYARMEVAETFFTSSNRPYTSTSSLEVYEQAIASCKLVLKPERLQTLSVILGITGMLSSPSKIKYFHPKIGDFIHAEI